MVEKFLIFGVITFGIYVLYLISCNKTSSEVTSEQTEIKNDSIKKLPQRFIDLLFAEQTIEEINKFPAELPIDQNSVRGKLQSVEILKNENKTDEAIIILKEIVNDKQSESRVIVSAWKSLRELGETSSTLKVLGVVLEVPIENTTEYLAMYSDGTARYTNYTGTGAIWETHTNEMDKFILDITSKSQNFVNTETLRIGRSKSKTDNVRFSFLTTSGILQIEKSFDELSQKRTDIGEIYMAAIQVLTLIVTSADKK